MWWFATLSAWVKPDKTVDEDVSQLEVKNRDPQTNEGVNLETISRTLLRIVARLPKREYHDDKSNGHNRRQADEFPLDDLPDPASDVTTSQG